MRIKEKLFLGLALLILFQTATAQLNELPMEYQTKIDAVYAGQGTIINSLNDLKVQTHNDLASILNRMDTIEKQQETMNKRIEAVPDQTSLIITLFVFSTLFFSLLFLTIAKGWWPSARGKKG